MDDYRPNLQETQLMTVKDWLITLLLLSIPIVNIVLLFVWAFGDSTGEQKANFAKAQLIWMAIVFGFVLVIYTLLGAVFFGAMAGAENFPQ